MLLQKRAARIPGPDVTFTLPTLLYGVFQRDFHIPLLTAWNINIERQLGASLRESNPAVYLPGGSSEDNTQQRRLYQNFSAWVLQLNVEKRFGHGLSMLANY